MDPRQIFGEDLTDEEVIEWRTLVLSGAGLTSKEPKGETIDLNVNQLNKTIHAEVQ